MRFLAAAAVLCLWAASVGTASAASYPAGVVGFGSGFSTAGETSGYSDPSYSLCTVGEQNFGHDVYARCALEFDVSLFPAGVVINSATLSVHTSPVAACASVNCQVRVYGYAGDAIFSIADLTAGTLLGTMGGTGKGATSTIGVRDHVEAILQSGAGVPIVGIALGRSPTNPNEDRTVISHTSTANPPTLVINYSVAEELAVDIVAIGLGAGSVVSAPGNLDCPAVKCSTQVGVGASVLLTAEPETGSTFDHWEGGVCDGQDATCAFEMPSETTSVVAYFSNLGPPVSSPPKTPAPTRSPQPTAPTNATPSPPPTAPLNATPSPPPTPPAAATPTPPPAPAPTPTPPPPPPTTPAGGGAGGWVAPMLLLGVIVVLACGGLFVWRRRLGPTDPHYPGDPHFPTNPFGPTEPYGPTDPYVPSDRYGPTEPYIPTEPHYPTDPHIPTDSSIPTEPHYPTEPHIPSDPHYPGEPHSPTERYGPTEPYFPTDPHIPTDPH